MPSLARRTATIAVMLTSQTLLSPLQGQTTIASNSLFASSYVFRGMTLTNVPTAQPKLSLSRPSFGGTVSAFVGGNVEFAVPSSANALSEGGGVSGMNEIDVVAQFSHAIGPSTISLGATRYQFSGHNRVYTPDWNTTELFIGARADHWFGTPSIVANWDIETIHGVYVEAAASRTLHAGGLAPTVGLLAGYTLGQEAAGALDQYYNFSERGVTHVDASVAQSVAVFGVTLTPNMHVQYSPEGQNTRAVGALPSHRNRATKVWVGVDIGFSHLTGAH
jgi:hypothetical protein